MILKLPFSAASLEKLVFSNLEYALGTMSVSKKSSNLAFQQGLSRIIGGKREDVLSSADQSKALNLYVLILTSMCVHD